MDENQQWAEVAKHKIRELKKAQYIQRIQMELTFETTPRDSRYSNGLLELMKKEEGIMKDSSNSTAVKAIVQKVDDALRAETQAFFARNAAQNIKRWASLKQKLLKEVQALRTEIMTNDGFGRSKPHGKRIVEPVDSLEAEAERLEADYNKNWFHYENYNLQQAFKSQTARVESDWQAHEQSVIDDYKSRKEALGFDCHDVRSSNSFASPGSDQRWQHPEKQKTLIHTAPVLTPTRDLSSSGDFNNKWAKGKKEVELDKLDREYRLNMESLEKQKAEAKRWLLRQQVRLMAQAEEVHKEKQVIGELMECLMEEFNTVNGLVQSRN